MRIVYAIWRDIRGLLEGEPDVTQLRAFVQRQTRDDRHPDGVAAPEFCDHPQLVAVIEGLKGWRDGLRAKAARAAH